MYTKVLYIYLELRSISICVYIYIKKHVFMIVYAAIPSRSGNFTTTVLEKECLMNIGNKAINLIHILPR